MEFQTKIHSSPKTETVINISGIKEIEELIPTDEDIIQWEADQLDQITNNKEFDPIHIKVEKSIYISILTKLYKKIGKQIRLYYEEEDLMFTIQDFKNEFYKEIKQINLYSKQYRLPMVIIET